MPNSRPAFTTLQVRKCLVGDITSLRRVFDFLEHWGLINADKMCRPPGTPYPLPVPGAAQPTSAHPPATPSAADAAAAAGDGGAAGAGAAASDAAATAAGTVAGTGTSTAGVDGTDTAAAAATRGPATRERKATCREEGRGRDPEHSNQAT